MTKDGTGTLLVVMLLGVSPAFASHNETLCLPDGTTALLTTDPGLHLLLSLEEQSGNRIDASGRGNDLEPFNNPGHSADHQEGDFSLDLTKASSQRLQRSSGDLAAGFPGNTGGANTELSVAGWVKMKSVTNHPLVVKASTTAGRSWSLWIWDFGSGPTIDPNVVDTSGTMGGGGADFHGTTVLQVDQWYHFVYTYDGNTGMSNVYLDGQLDAGPFDEQMTNYRQGTDPLRVGFRPGFGFDYADALLDEIVVLDRVLTPDEVLSLYENGVVPPSVFCSDGDACNGLETCNPLVGCEPGSPPNCDDTNVCTDDDCNPLTGCVHTDNDDPCDDGLFCNGTDLCSGGTCTHSGDPCAAGAECNDLCDDSADNCLVPLGGPCTDDGNPCTDDVCDGAGSCGMNNTDPCDDGLFCTGTDLCSGGTCTHSGDPCTGGPECDDTCDDSADTCHTPLGTSCTADANPCTDDVCDGSGACGVNNTDFCDDGSVCTQIDQCSGGACMGSSPLDCNDGSLCTQDLCDPIDGCQHNSAFAASCRTASKSVLFIKQKGGKNDKLIWKWIRGEATTQADLSDPTSGADYTLCLYSGGTADLIATATIPADPVKWSTVGTRGYRYKDSSLSPDGIRSAVVKGGSDDKAKAAVKGKGQNLPDLPLGGLPLPVTAQLINDQTGLCLQAAYDQQDVIMNETEKFKARSRN